MAADLSDDDKAIIAELLREVITAGSLPKPLVEPLPPPKPPGQPSMALAKRRWR